MESLFRCDVAGRSVLVGHYGESERIMKNGRKALRSKTVLPGQACRSATDDKKDGIWCKGRNEVVGSRDGIRDGPK